MVPNPAWENIYLYLNKFQDFSTLCIKEIFWGENHLVQVSRDALRINL